MEKQCYQRNPINLSSSANPFGDLKLNEFAIEETKKYFKMTQIDAKKHGEKQLIKYEVPFITLFMNTSYRKQFLSFTKGNIDESVIRLQNILINDQLRRKYYLSMVESIGDLCKKYGLKVFQITTFSYTKKSASKDGIRLKFYLNTDGIPSENPDYIDLTNSYYKIKEFRKKTSISSGISLSKQKKAE